MPKNFSRNLLHEIYIDKSDKSNFFAKTSCHVDWIAEQLTSQWIPSLLRKTLNSCWLKTYGKKDMEKIWKIMGWSALLPKIKKEDKNPSGSYHNHLPPFFRGLWGVFRCHMCPVTSGRVDNCVRVAQRPYACLTISGSGVRCAANARYYRGLHILFPWWKRSRSVVSSHFRLILSQEIMVPELSSFF